MSDQIDQVAYITELKEFVVRHFADQKRAIRDMRQLRAMTHDVQIPEEYKITARPVKTPILADMLNRVEATLTVNYPTYRRDLMGDRVSDEKNSSLIEKWLAGSDLRMEINARRATFAHLMDAAVADGMGVCQLQWLPGAWSPFPKRKRDERGAYSEEADPYLKRLKNHVRKAPFPFAAKDLDPLSYYYWDSYDNKREVIIVEQVPLAPAARALGVQRNTSTRKWESATPGQPVADGKVTGDNTELVQWWTDDKATYLLDGEHARTIKHNFGRQCFFDFAGLSTHERAPDRAYLSVAFAFAHLIPFIDRLLTMKANWVYLNAYPRTFVKLRQERMTSLHQVKAALADEAAQQTRTVDISTGLEKLAGLITLYQDEEVGYLIPPNVGGDLDQMISLATSMAQQAGIGDVMRGQGMGSDASGYLANQLMTAARLAYDPITRNAKAMLRNTAEWRLYVVDQIARTGVPVYGESLDAGSNKRALLELSDREIDGIYEIEPQLDPLLPSNFIMEGRFWLEQWEKGGVSKRTYQEKGLHLQSPEEEDYRRLLEDAKKQVEPQMIEAAGRKAKILALPAPAPPQLVDQYGQPMLNQGGGTDLGNLGMPVTPGQGMPLTPEQVVPGGMPAMPGGGIPGQQAPGLPGGNFGQQAVLNA